MEPRAVFERVPAVGIAPPTLFKSFWMGGFESACQLNTQCRRIDMIARTQHDSQADLDYANLRRVGISTARDGIRWPLIETAPGVYDFSSFDSQLNASIRHGVQVLWNLCHYGWPDDLDLFSADFVPRFARYCAAVARHIRARSDDTMLFCPINEMSFLAWAIGERLIIHPVRPGRAEEAKHQIIRAAIAGMEAIWQIDPTSRFAHIDPIIRVLPKSDHPDDIAAARAQHNAQYAAWDMIAGRLNPELGGAAKYLDVVGVNYYHSNQWIQPDVRLPWEAKPRDPRYAPFNVMLRECYDRYQRPIFVAETSHFGAGRAQWLEEMAQACCDARQDGIPLEGLCIYPIIDRPDWENDDHWHNSGLWDLLPDHQGKLQRVLHGEYAAALRDAQRSMRLHGCI
jgi:beta-glucosidase/6-phospho-beta-glucosidase/beta-galactosidase